MAEPVFSFTASAGDRFGEGMCAAFDNVRRRRHLEALDQSPILEPLAESLDRAWVAVHRPGRGEGERFFLNEAALAVYRFAGLQLPPMKPFTGDLPRPLVILCAGDLAEAGGAASP
jgi:hypothetical protein